MSISTRLPMLHKREARRLAWRGHLAALEQIADALGRTWLPLAIPIALRHRRMRAILATSIVIQGTRDFRRRRPPLGPVRFVAIRALDDAAYGVGVVVGSIRHRNIGALLPKLTNWPGRKRADEDAAL